jgi:hypothetical protein
MSSLQKSLNGASPSLSASQHIGVLPPDINRARSFSTWQMTTTWHHPLDTPERPARMARGTNRAATEFRTAWQGLTDNLMDQITDPANLERERLDEPVARPRRWRWKATALGVAAALGLYFAWLGLAPHRGNQAAAAPTPTPVVTVSQPLQREVDVRAGFLGQFSAIDRVELRAQVGCGPRWAVR